VTSGAQDRGYCLDCQPVALATEASDHPCRHGAHYRNLAPGFPSLGVGEVQFDYRPVKGRQRVMERPGVMGQRPRVDDDRGGAAARVMHCLDDGPLVLGLDVLNREAVRAVPIAAGSNPAAAVVPNETTIASGEYAPLSRPLFLYVNRRALRRPEVVEYLNFYLDRGPGLAAEVHSLPLPPAEYAEARAQLTRAAAGAF